MSKVLNTIMEAAEPIDSDAYTYNHYLNIIAELELYKKALRNEIWNGDDCGCGITCDMKPECGSDECLKLHLDAAREE